MKYGAGNFSVLISVPLQMKAPPASTKLIFASDFLRSAMAASSAESPVVHAVEMVQEEAAFVNGESVKCTIAPARTAPASSSTGEKISTICSAPSVQGVQASAPLEGSTLIHSTRPSLPCARTSNGVVTLASSSFT